MSIVPIRPKLPPLNALRTFEAAARLGGFTAAAVELCVTPAAVSQQVKVLEYWTGASLFQRKAQGLVLTDQGRQCYDALKPIFDQLGMAVLSMRTAARPNRLHIAALPSIAQLWLSPRLPRIRDQINGVDISITAMESPPNFDREPFDLALFFYDTPQGVVLAADQIFPVACPDVASCIQQIDDLATVNCLIDTTWDRDWDRWLQGHSPTPPKVNGSTFSLYALALTEAINGAGVLMGHSTLIQDALRSQQLVPVFGDLAQNSLFLCALRPEHAPAQPYCDAVLEMLRQHP